MTRLFALLKNLHRDSLCFYLFLMLILNHVTAVASDFELPQINAKSQYRQVFIEALILKTDISNSFNFGVSGVTSLKLEGVTDPFIGTILTYQGANFETIDELIDALKIDSAVEIIGASKLVCQEHLTTELFNRSAYKLDKALIPKALKKVNSYEDQPLSSGFALSLKPQIVNGKRIDLRIFLENAKPVGEERANLVGQSDYVPQSTISQVATSISVPEGFFTLLSGILFEDRQSIILILKPIIVE